VVDFVRWQNAPNFATDNLRKVNWGKWVSICEHLLQLGSLQRQFHAIDTHDFISRPKVRKILMEMPLMPEEVLHILGRVKFVAEMTQFPRRSSTPAPHQSIRGTAPNTLRAKP
jgi:hypothetical protein